MNGRVALIGIYIEEPNFISLNDRGCRRDRGWAFRHSAAHLNERPLAEGVLGSGFWVHVDIDATTAVVAIELGLSLWMGQMRYCPWLCRNRTRGDGFCLR